ncbi:reverse transcriptase-like protein [Candidatus Peregrinibacteria bacterium]|nr:reverse transcriptase-like protein [Candidatus Peregrinibacteria bacterium]
MVTIYTDGSCKGNPGPGGWAAIFLNESQNQPIKVLKGSSINTTNNRMEMAAIIEALEYVKKEFGKERVKIISDSNLLVQSLNLGWKRKANLDLWEKLDDARKNLQVEYSWVKGHATNKWNNECDKIANKEADNPSGEMSAYDNSNPNQDTLF